ncbi:MAG: DNA mismatch endonuclease Vsr [Phycisphaerales bacterium]|nr:DNA mismatch endonuclease Vsr [Phycisphaerales bacterium]
MSRIPSKNTGPEQCVAAIVRQMGISFRRTGTDLPGSPDIVLARVRLAVFIHGCFWHRHHRCRFAYVPKTRRAFWTTKFNINCQRDKRVRRQLRARGWGSLVIWECEVKNVVKVSRRLSQCANRRARRQGIVPSVVPILPQGASMRDARRWLRELEQVGCSPNGRDVCDQAWEKLIAQGPFSHRQAASINRSLRVAIGAVPELARRSKTRKLRGEQV